MPLMTGDVNNPPRNGKMTLHPHEPAVSPTPAPTPATATARTAP